MKAPRIRLTKSVKEIADEKALNYIANYWPRLRRENTHDDGSLIGLPNPYLIPSDDTHEHYALAEQYYWDTYFVAIGLTSEKDEALVSGMLENLLILFERFGVIPNASRMYFTGRSQPPLLTSIIFLVYNSFNKSEAWLKKHIAIAEQEYRRVWMSSQHPLWHQVHKGLSRYYDINVLHDLAEAESGWDMTPRFERKCLDFLPVDLNALLFKYEMDFAKASEIFNDKNSANKWRKLASDRRSVMDELMWGKLRGFFFDYNYQRKVLGNTWSLAGFFPMWVGMVSEQQAERMVSNLNKFEHSGGLSTTSRPLIDTTIFGSLKTQWAFPNGWAPLHVVVIDGLRLYGYKEEADRIAKKWLSTNIRWFEKNGVFLEKYNVVNVKKEPLQGVYPNQSGFGWTNGSFVYLTEQLKNQQT